MAHKMKHRVKRMWSKALRSGKFEQAIGRLYFRDHYCCLGVLCRLYADEKKVDFESLIKDHKTLPYEVSAWAGLKTCNPWIGGTTTAADLNDMEGKNFVEIARLINKHL